jgi:murein DD-endopeptidase MepM/ murein hydrolase activator NlpD
MRGIWTFDEQAWRARGVALAAGVARHGRVAAAAIAGFLAISGTVVFAVAPLAPDASQLPVRLVEQEVPLGDLSGQLEALASHETELTRTEVTRPADTPEATLRRLGVNDAAALQLLRQEPGLRRALDPRTRVLVTVRAGLSGELFELVVRGPAAQPARLRTHFERWRAAREGDRWTVQREQLPLASQTQLSGNVVSSTLQAAATQVRLPQPITRQLIELQSADPDAPRALRRGDVFAVVYEALTADGSPVPWTGAGYRALAVEFQSGGKSRQAFWYEDAKGKGSWYDRDGRGRKQVFQTLPLEHARATSPFAVRMHPLLQRLREHRGIDYSAPHGTPVRSVGDGVVTFAGWQGGYGNVIYVDHGRNRVTLYAHLSKMGVKAGQRVESGQFIGAVGATGWATGPHLHFEFRVNGVHVDPRSLARTAEETLLDPVARSQFEAVTRVRQAKLDLAETLESSRPSFE